MGRIANGIGTRTVNCKIGCTANIYPRVTTVGSHLDLQGSYAQIARGNYAFISERAHSTSCSMFVTCVARFLGGYSEIWVSRIGYPERDAVLH